VKDQGDPRSEARAIGRMSDFINSLDSGSGPGMTRGGQGSSLSCAKRIRLPFVPTFSNETERVHHGKHFSLNQSESKLLETSYVRARSIVFVDDCITSGATAGLCYAVMVALGNLVDDLICARNRDAQS